MELFILYYQLYLILVALNYTYISRIGSCNKR